MIVTANPSEISSSECRETPALVFTKDADSTTTATRSHRARAAADGSGNGGAQLARPDSREASEDLDQYSTCYQLNDGSRDQLIEATQSSYHQQHLDNNSIHLENQANCLQVQQQHQAQTSIKYQLVKTTTMCYSSSVTTVATRRLAFVFAIALSSYCIISAAKLGYCAPVAGTTEPAKVGVSTTHVVGENYISTRPDLTTKSQTPLSSSSNVMLDSHNQPQMGKLDAKSLNAAATVQAPIVQEANTSQADDGQDDDILSKLLADSVAPLSEDGTMVLVIANKLPSPASSIRRLMKRSGISDQRLAEIQMIRALKKQLERTSKITGSETGSSTPEATS